MLTAGLATRLRPLSFVRAKAALPIGDRAIVQRILQWLAGYGVTAAVLNLHHLPHTITRIVGDGTDEHVRIRYSWEMPVLGSAGGPRRALPLLDGSTFLIVNGDTLTNVNVSDLVDAHRKRRRHHGFHPRGFDPAIISLHRRTGCGDCSICLAAR